jgi:hypothetical protein
MSSRPFLKPFSVVTNGDMSSSITSAVTVVQMIPAGSYQYSWTGTSPVGTIKVQGSNDYSIDAGGTVVNSGTWTDLYLTYNGTSASSVALTGNSGSGLVDFDGFGSYAIRTVYTRTSGIGTLNVKICGKVK